MIYKQREKVAMDLPLDLLLADVFVTTLERTKLNQSIGAFDCYWRYVDDIFCVTEVASNIKLATIKQFINVRKNNINNAYLAISLTMEKKLISHKPF